MNANLVHTLRSRFPWRWRNNILTCRYCGFLDWTNETYGRLTHKHACPLRTDSYCQSHPKGCP